MLISRGGELSPKKLVREIAALAHDGQVDKSGAAYINHPIAVSELVLLVPSYGALSEEGKRCAELAAMLHDVLEDCPGISAELLLANGVPRDVVEVVVKLSRNLSKDGYYEGIAADAVARVVKIADARHNSDPDRLSLLDEASVSRLRSKYLKCVRAISASNPEDFNWFVIQTGPAESGWNG